MHLQQLLKRMQISKLGLGKEYQLSTEGTRNRYLFREKMVYERIRVWTSGQSLPPLPPPPGASHVNKKSWNCIHIQWGMGASFGHEADVTLLQLKWTVISMCMAYMIFLVIAWEVMSASKFFSGQGWLGEKRPSRSFPSPTLVHCSLSLLIS